MVTSWRVSLLGGHQTSSMALVNEWRGLIGPKFKPECCFAYIAAYTAIIVAFTIRKSKLGPLNAVYRVLQQVNRTDIATMSCSGLLPNLFRNQSSLMYVNQCLLCRSQANIF
jgi:hypothetical protein